MAMTNNLRDSRNIRIFISSTFNDMQSERDHLVNDIFPILRKESEKRGVTLTEVDLRWGITAKDAESGRVIELCMDEIVNSHPFFIGLLGDRYGWTPSKEEMLKIEAIPDRYSFIVKDLENGLSITEIEIQFGVLRAEDEVNASFYIKKSGEGIPDPRQERLKKSVRAQSKHTVYDYETVDQLGDQVMREFRLLLDRLYPENEVPTAEERRRMEQNTYILEKTQIYIPNADDLAEIDAFIKDDERQLMVLTGDSGMGKSAMLAYWTRQAELSGVRTLPFFLSAGQADSPLSVMLTYLIDEISRLYGVDKNYSAEADEAQIIESFKQMIQTVADRDSLVIVVDGINQAMDGANHAKQMKWLPEMPENIKMLFSTLEEDETYESLKKRGVKELKLYPMLADRKRELIIAYFEKFRKTLDDKYVNMLMESRNVTENTLILTLMLDDLRRFGRYDHMEQYIRDYVDSVTTEDFLDKLIARKQQHYAEERCPSVVKDYLSMIALAEDGLNEHDIIGISGQPGLFWSYFYCGNRQLFVSFGGRVRFSHQQIRMAVENRFLKDEGYVKGIRERIVTFFQSHRDCEYGYFDEVANQLYQLGLYDRLYLHLLDESYVTYMLQKNRQQILMRYWGALYVADRTRYDITRYIKNFTRFWGKDADDIVGDEEMRRYIWENGAGYFYSMVQMTAQYLEDFDAVYKMCVFMRIMDNKGEGENSARSSMVANLLAVYYMKKKMYGEALKLLIDDIDPESEDAASSVSLFNIAEIYTCMGESADMKQYYEKAALIYEYVLQARLERYGEGSKYLADLYANIAGVYTYLGDMEKASYYRHKAIEIYSESPGGSRIDIGIEYRNMADEAYDRGDYRMALQYASKSCEIFQEMGEGLGEFLMDSYVQKAQACQALELFDEAENAVDQYARLWHKACPTGKEEKAIPFDRLSVMYYQCKSYQKAYDYGLKCVAALQAKETKDNGMLATVHNYLGKYCMLMDRKNDCEKHYRTAAEYHRKDGNMESVADSIMALGEALFELGDEDHALLSFCEAMDVMKASGRDEDVVKICQQCIDQLVHNKETGRALPPENAFVDDCVTDFAAIADGHNELIDIFMRGKSAFDVGNTKAAIHCFEFALTWCNAHDISAKDIIRAPIYRLLAYSKELVHEEEFEKTVNRDYRHAVNICATARQPQIGRKCAKDWAEYNWNRKQYDEAVVAYFFEMAFLILEGDKDLKWQVYSTLNLCNAMTKGEKYDEELYLAAAYYSYSRALAADDEELMPYTRKTINYGLMKKAEHDPNFHPEDYHMKMEDALCVLAQHFSDIGMPEASEKLLKGFAGAMEDCLDENSVSFFFTLYSKMISLYIDNGYNEAALLVINDVAGHINGIVGVEEFYEELKDLSAIACHQTMRFEQAITLLSNQEQKEWQKVMLADCYYAIGAYEKALEMLKNVSDDFELDDSSCLVFARVLLRFGNTDEAENYLDLDEKQMYTEDLLQLKCLKAVVATVRGNNREATQYIHHVKQELDDIPISSSVRQAPVYWALIDALRCIGMNDEAKNVLCEYRKFLNAYQPSYVEGLLEECKRLDSDI